MPLRIIHVLAKEVPGELSGVDMHVLELAQAQQRNGHHPLVVERGAPEFVRRAKRGGIAVASTQGLRLHSAVRLLRRATTGPGSDLVHAHGPASDAWAFAALAGRRGRTSGPRLVCTQHGIVEDTWRGRLVTRADSLCMRTADGIIACAEHLVSRMQRWSPRAEVRYIPNGVGWPEPLERRLARKSLAAEYGIPPEPGLVCYVGRLSPEKRPDRVIDAVASLDGDLADTQLLIAGAGPWEERLRAQAERLGVGSRTTFAGLVRDLSVVYAAADAVVLLSHTEATPRVLVEAMASGAPVVASQVGGIPQLLGEGAFGRLVAEPDSADAANALRETLTGRAPSRAAAREHARLHFGIDAMAAQVEKFYGDVMAMRSGTAPEQSMRGAR